MAAGSKLFGLVFPGEESESESLFESIFYGELLKCAAFAASTTIKTSRQSSGKQ
jgi:hypothetical protein